MVIIEIPPRMLFSMKWYMSISVVGSSETRDILRAASQARPGAVQWCTRIKSVVC